MGKWGLSHEMTGSLQLQYFIYFPLIFFFSLAPLVFLVCNNVLEDWMTHKSQLTMHQTCLPHASLHLLIISFSCWFSWRVLFAFPFSVLSLTVWSFQSQFQLMKMEKSVLLKLIIYKSLRVLLWLVASQH